MLKTKGLSGSNRMKVEGKNRSDFFVLGSQEENIGQRTSCTNDISYYNRFYFRQRWKIHQNHRYFI